MGLFSGLATLPIAPVRGVIAIARLLEREALRQTTDPAVIREQLAAVDAAYDRGEISAEQRDLEQDELVARLLTAQDERS